VLVTGASGFIGRHTLAALAPERTVRTLHRGKALPEAADHASLNVATDSLLPAMDGVSDIIHLAGVGDVGASQDDPLGYNLVNAVGTLRILEAARLRDATVVFASTQHVLRPSVGRLTERSAPHPQNVYGASKLMAERWCELYGRIYGVRARVVRLFSVYGPGQIGQGNSGVVSIFFQRAAHDEPIIVMSSQRRDFTHVTDAVRGLIAALDYASGGHAVFNVGTGVGTSFSRLARMIRKLLGSRSRIDESQMQPTRRHLIPSVEAARGQLGYTARITLSEGLQDYRDWTQQATIRTA
jgi:UDP-glucose 4-epimerase